MILHQNLTSDNFLWVNCNVEPESIPVNFPGCYFKPKWFIMHLDSFNMHDLLTCIDHLENIGSVSYDLLNIDKNY